MVNDSIDRKQRIKRLKNRAVILRMSHSMLVLVAAASSNTRGKYSKYSENYKFVLMKKVYCSQRFDEILRIIFLYFLKAAPNMQLLACFSCVFSSIFVSPNFTIIGLEIPRTV